MSDILPRFSCCFFFWTAKEHLSQICQKAASDSKKVLAVICCPSDTHAGRRRQLTLLWAAAVSRLDVGELRFPTPHKRHRWQDLTQQRNKCWCCVRRREPNGKGRQSKKGLPRSSTFTSCCCLCWLPPPLPTALSPPSSSPRHQDRPASPWRGNQTFCQRRGHKGLIKGGWQCRMEPNQEG